MADNQNIIEAWDWSKIDTQQLPYSENLFCYTNVNNAGIDNLGIWINEKGEYWTSGYSGVCVLKDKNGDDYIYNGKTVILVVRPRFKTSAFSMLANVICDDEYDKYVSSLDHELFEFYDDPPIRIKVDHSGGDLLLAFSFIKSCYRICTKLLNHKMKFYNENLIGKVRGKIDFPNHLKKNVFYGREDRIYCKYPFFSEDTIENRILKKALGLSERIMYAYNYEPIEGMANIREMLIYSKRRLSGIAEGEIKRSDFLTVNVNGFNSLYAPAIGLAKLLIDNVGINVGLSRSHFGYVIPYAIRMESVFEFYIRSQIKSYIKAKGIDDIKLDIFRSRSNNNLLKTTKNRSYLMQEYIPDIALMKFNNAKGCWEYAVVLDVKYQRSLMGVMSSTRRHNTHQLMFYALLLNVKGCGFVFPQGADVKPQHNNEQLVLQCGNADSTERFYSEFYISESGDAQANEFERMIDYARCL